MVKFWTMDERVEGSIPRADLLGNKAGYTATPVACGWAGAIIEVFPSFGQEQ